MALARADSSTVSMAASSITDFTQNATQERGILKRGFLAKVPALMTGFLDFWPYRRDSVRGASFLGTRPAGRRDLNPRARGTGGLFYTPDQRAKMRMYFLPIGNTKALRPTSNIMGP